MVNLELNWQQYFHKLFEIYKNDLLNFNKNVLYFAAYLIMSIILILSSESIKSIIIPQLETIVNLINFLGVVSILFLIIVSTKPIQYKSNRALNDVFEIFSYIASALFDILVLITIIVFISFCEQITLNKTYLFLYSLILMILVKFLLVAFDFHKVPNKN